MELLNFETGLTALLQVGEWSSLAEAHEHALVVLAMGIDCSVHATGHGYEILTAEEDATAARHELALYASEQWQTKPSAPPIETPSYPFGFAWMLSWAAILTWTYFLQTNAPDFTDRFANSSRSLMENGEYWRPFTSLFLHGDAMHLMGNLLIGGMFCLLVAKSIGAWRAWPLILIGGTLGNAINAAIHYPENFESIGASTATFAALGILVGLAIIETARSGSYQRIRSLAIPLIAGLILFGMFGTSGERTDIAGHAWGALAGVALGAAVGWFRLGQAAQTSVAVFRQPCARSSRC